MGPENRAYFLPSSLVGVTPVPSRSHSPDYNSDTEIGVARHRKQVSSADRLTTERGRQRRSKREVKSAGLNDLVKWVCTNDFDDAILNLVDLIDLCRFSRLWLMLRTFWTRLFAIVTISLPMISVHYWYVRIYSTCLSNF